MARRTKEQTEQIKENAAYRYITDNTITIRQLAQKVGVTEKTLSNWAKEGKWKEKRISLLTTKSNQLAFLYNQLQNLNKTIAERDNNNYADTKEANTIIQLTTAIKNLETETSLGDIIQVAKNFTDFVNKTDNELAKEIVKQFDVYINSMATK